MNTIWQMWGDVPKDRPVEYARITHPTLILAAEKERVIPLYSRVLAHFRKHLPHARVETVARTGHLLLEEQPRACNQLIREFLGRPTATPQTRPAITT
jgi:pimeloyl-ACP methyl ester carboxylesterase